MSEKQLVAFDEADNDAARIAAIAELEGLRRDAERYRWFRDHSIQIVHTSTLSWAFHLDKLIDDAMGDRGYHPIRNSPCHETSERRISVDIAEDRFEGPVIGLAIHAPSKAQPCRPWLSKKKGRGAQ
ncbi:hypothetical protein [Pseudomonas huanghezhanensis]|uniref:hypothetical protein n=1 Tax=Pseudomonas huanghezhanensis TaxID=3002903 RepID=UPI002285F003|nr:hypothetical protein [Pseudomonas sp. BSw22131]